VKKSRLSKILKSKRFKKGGINSGTLYVVVIMLLVTSLSFFLVGGNLFNMPTSPTPAAYPGKQEIVFSSESAKKNLQLQTFTVKNTCESKIAVDFLIDISGSMGFDNGIKQTNEKNAVKAFTSRMVDKSVIGIQTFSSPQLVRENVPLSYYKDSKAQVQNTINTLPADGATSTRDAFNLAKQKLSAAISQKKFPGYKYVIILLTDGIPEAEPIKTDSNSCEIVVQDTERNVPRCFAKIQDPRIPTDISAEIKGQGVEIYSLALTSPHSSDRALQPSLTKLLQDVASTPLSTHFYSSDNGQDLKTQLDSVFTDICE